VVNRGQRGVPFGYGYSLIAGAVLRDWLVCDCKHTAVGVLLSHHTVTAGASKVVIAKKIASERTGDSIYENKQPDEKLQAPSVLLVSPL